MSWMTSTDFEMLYRSDPDPWKYETSTYEREKYAATLAACGPGRFACALELGSSIGVFSAMLAPRCERLVTIDAAATAVATARRRLADVSRVETVLGQIPETIPSVRCDLIVASEILYYLATDRFDRTLSALLGRMLPSARLVAVHWRPPGPERPFTAESAHARLHDEDRLTAILDASTEDYLLEVFTPA